MSVNSICLAFEGGFLLATLHEAREDEGRSTSGSVQSNDRFVFESASAQVPNTTSAILLKRHIPRTYNSHVQL